MCIRLHSKVFIMQGVPPGCQPEEPETMRLPCQSDVAAVGGGCRAGLHENGLFGSQLLCISHSQEKTA